MELSSLAFDLSQFSTASRGGLVGAGLEINARSVEDHSGWKAVPYPLGRRRPLVSDRCQRDCGVSTNQRSMGNSTKTPGRKRNAITEASTSGSSPFDQDHTNTARVETSDAIRYKEHPWNHLHAPSLTLSWAVASDMID